MVDHADDPPGDPERGREHAHDEDPDVVETRAHDEVSIQGPSAPNARKVATLCNSLEADQVLIAGLASFGIRIGPVLCRSCGQSSGRMPKAACRNGNSLKFFA